MISFLHSGTCKDVIYSLATIAAMAKEHKCKCNLYLQPNQPADYYQTGGNHPLGRVLLDKDYALKLITLVKCQPYIAECSLWEGQAYDICLDLVRSLGIDLGKGHLPRSYFHLCKIHADLSQPWLFIKSTCFNQQIVVNRTSRYRNHLISYQFLTKYDTTFVGTEQEFLQFRQEVPTCHYQDCEDFVRLAQIIANCSLFIGNNSLPFSLAEAMKKQPRVLEICPFLQNVIPHGSHAYDFQHQQPFESIVQAHLK